MSKLRIVLSWVGIIVLGLVTGVLEDIMFVTLLVPYLPTSLDLTGNLFWVFTVPLAQLAALAVTGTAAWFIGLHEPAKLAAFWLCWTLSRAAFLNAIDNPPGDILIYLAWILFWCGLFLLRGRSRRAKTVTG